jgi:trigger factor
VQVTIEDLGNCRKKLTIEIPAEKVTEDLDNRTDELKSTAELPGFRRGHIPARLFERRFGKKLREALRNDLTAEAFEEALSEHNLEPLGEPEFPGIEEIELERESMLKFEVELVVKPQVKVEDYMGVKVRAEEIEVTEEEVERTVENIRREEAELVVVEDRASAEEDMLMVDVEVTAEGQVLHSSSSSYIGVGSKGVFGIEIDNLTGKLTGRNRGETVEIEFELPGACALEYGEELAGKQARCTLKINEIKTVKMPEATDELAKDAGFDSLAELKEKIKESVRTSKEHARDRYVEKKILDKLLESTGFEVPAEMIEAKAHMLMEYRRYQLLKEGVDSKKIDADLDSYKELSRQEIERNFREGLVLNKVAELENIFVTEGEVDSAINQIALGRGQSPDVLREEMESRSLVARLREDLRDSKVREFLREKAEVELVPPGTLSKEEKPEDPEEAQREAGDEAGVAQEQAEEVEAEKEEETTE